MRRRAKRDLLTLLGVVIIVSGVVVVNGYMRLDSLKEAARKVRIKFEEKHRSEGVELIEWDLLRQTKGFFRTGPTFPEELIAKDEHLVNICGFMTPIDQFRNVTEYMLLPVPITCYFCESPPARDVIQIKLERPTNMVNEPVLNGGELHLNKKGDLFFYTIAHAKWNEAVKDQELTKKTTSADHMLHLEEGWRKLRQGEGEEELEEGFEPPAPAEEPPPTEAPTIKADDPSTWRAGGPGGHVPPVDMGDLLPGQDPPAGEVDSDAGES